MIVLGLELMLLSLGALSPRVDTLLSPTTPFAEDPVLGLVGRPRFPDHDAAGFRNERALQRARVVVMGDSQTYGTGVARSDTWPAQLGREVVGGVYSMAIPGYGPTQQLLLFDRALELDPEVVLATLYTGNDAYDCFLSVHGRGQLEELRGPDLAGVGYDTLRTGLEGRINEGLGRAIGRSRPAPRKGVRAWLSNHSRLYGLARAARRTLGSRVLAAAAPTWSERMERAAASGGAQVPFEGAGLRTIFTPAYRTLALDPTDPCIAEGRRIALEALLALGRRAEAAGVKLIVLVIPTKERVYAQVSGTPAPAHRNLVEVEEEFLGQTLARLNAAGLHVVDGLEALREPLAEGRDTYPAHQDGHPNALGHRCLAVAVARELSIAE